MTELEAKLYHMFVQRFNVLAPIRGVEMTQYQIHQMSTDFAVMAAKVVLDEKSKNYQGQK